MRGKDEYNVKFQSEDGCEGVLSRDGGGVPSAMERLPGDLDNAELSSA